MNNIISLVAGVVLGGVLVMIAGLGAPTELGGVPGVALYPQSVTNFTQGGGVLAITESDNAVTLTAEQMQNYNVIRMTGSAYASATTLTLPATSTLSNVIPNPGDYREWVIENANTAAATTTTIAAGTGIDLQEPDGQNVVVGINNYAFLTCFREASTNIVCRVDETIPAD